MGEKDLLEPNSYYAVAKAAQSMLCQYIARFQEKPVVTFRLFSVYGPYEEPSRLVPKLMEAFFQGDSIDLVQPKIAHDFIFVDDIIEAYLNVAALKKNPGKIFNIGTGKQTTIKEMADILQTVTGKTADLRWGAMPSRPWDTAHWVGDVTQAKDQLGWSSGVSVEEGLSKTWQWYCKNQRDHSCH